jgi:oligoendopeptidase F
MSESPNSAAEIAWNLGDLFTGIDDPKIEATLAGAKKRAEVFQKTYQGKIDSPNLTASTLVASLRELESIGVDSAKPGSFASLRFAADTSDTNNQAFMQKMMERSTEISIPLIFFDIELANVSDDIINPLLSDPDVAKYRHYIDTVRLYREHMLSETEEKLLEETANTGARAFRRLFEQVTSSQKYEFRGEQLTQSAVLAKLYSADREERREGAQSFSKGLEGSLPVVTYVSNTLMQDKNVKDRLRKYTYPEQSRHLSNELSAETVEIVASSCEKNFNLVNRYYKVKRDILGLETLTHYDRYAPLFESDRQVVWGDAKKIVLDAFGAFSPIMHERASEFFDKGWIDAAPRAGKRGGAFCSYITPDLHPYVLMSYLERSRDVMTLAHELGHGVHASLSRGQTYFNYYGTLPMAELASTFGEMLVFEKLVATADTKERLALVGGKIEDSFATIFRQASMYRFEQKIHKHRREIGELTTADFGGYWQECIATMFGDSLVLGEEHRTWWSYVGHFIASPFYVYAYSFGELLVLSLFQKYKKEGPSFADKYLGVLKCGGSMTPQQLMDQVGVNLSDPAFWQGGMDVLANEIGTFEGLWKEYKSV